MSHNISPNDANWMQQLGDVADHIKITEFALPGSHDAASYGDINERSKTQAYSIKQQLEAGFRYFDLRVKVNNSVFFAHHGWDNAEKNQYCPDHPLPEGATSSIFQDIKGFIADHPSEFIILHFYDTAAVIGQDFNSQDRCDFIKHVAEAFAGNMAPPPKTGIAPTYGELKENRTQVVVLINDIATWAFDKTFTKELCAKNNIWLASEWFGERYSAYHRFAWRDYKELYELTAADQEEYLFAETSADKFWITQSILAYDNASTSDGHSANYYGAQAMNSMWADGYSNWANGKHWNGAPLNQKVRRPNVLLVDYSGYFYDQFPALFQAIMRDAGKNPNYIS